MRLLTCQLQNVRQHGDLTLEFAPGLTLIGGPNESGKSTLVEALHRALFLRASATGAPVEALQSRLHTGHPLVQLSFEARGDVWSLSKRFSGSTGRVTLQARSSGRPLSGPEAEEVLAELLGVGEMLGGAQARSVLPGRWAHLWVRQGDAADDPLARGRTSYDFDQLRLQLERSGGAAVQQSAHDQRVEQRIQQLLEANLTSRGPKAKSPLAQHEQELRSAQLRMDEALASLQAYEDASQELTAIGEQLEQLQSEELPALKTRQQAVQRAVAEAGRLDGAIQLAARSLEPIRLRHGAAAQALQQFDALQAERDQRQQRLAQLEASVAGAECREEELTTAGHQCRSRWETLTLQRQTLEHRQQLLQRLLDRAAASEALQRLDGELQRLRQAAERRQALEQQLAALPRLTRQELQQLRQLDQRQRDARTRLEAMAAGVTLLRADQPVWIDGQPLPPGEQRRLSRVFQLQVGEDVLLEIAPGGGQALEDLEGTLQTAQEQLSARLSALGAANLEAAEALLEQRTGLEQQLAGLAGAASDQLEPLARQRLGLEQRLQDLDAELEELAPVRQALEQEQALPQAQPELEALQQQIRSTLQQTGAAARAAEQELEAARSALLQFRQQRLEEASQLEVVRGELRDRSERLQRMVGEKGDREAQLAALAALQAELGQAEAGLAQLQAERAALGTQDPERERQDIEARLDALNRRQAQLFDQRGAAKQRCDSISAEDPFAAVEQARLQLETASADQGRMWRLIQAHTLLKDLFQQAQAELSSRYSEPLAQAIGTYLGPLIPESPHGPVARLSYDQATGFQGLQLRRGREYYDFGSLSGGMREQLAAALRLSMADVLKGAHDGCLPLVFDDAFTNADPSRIDLVKHMLGQARDRGLQVILLTCDPAAYGAVADRVVELSAG
ncbi:MAG: AAA family ATPase [Synechococcaceae cyanobacterium]|nr:AAA family ATPase [Synechococcaceae cyanobacterium]